jgi:hypothetical protein
MSSKGIQFMTEEEIGLELQHINVKLLLSEQAGLDLQALIPVFHSWIQEQPFNELLLDVADYTHVKDGPGVLLVGHEADYSIDNTDGRLGVRYNRKAPLGGSNHDKLRQGFRAVLNASERLAQEATVKEYFKIGGQDIEVVINDRLIAPNDEETRKLLDPDFRQFFDVLLGANEYSLQYEADRRKLFGVRVHSQQAFLTQTLLQKVSEEV